MKKIFNSIMTLLITMLLVATSIAPTASAQCLRDPPFVISEVVVDDVVNPNLISIERGNAVNIRVRLSANCDAEDVRVKAWIGGYEYGDVEDSTSIFDVTENVTYIKNLVLQIPNDIDSSQSYMLNVEAFNDQHTDRESFLVRIDSARHLLNFVDVIFNPGLSVRNTQPLFITVRVENLGQKKEEDIRVEVSIPELGLSQRTFIDELVPVESTNDNDEETSSSSDTLLLDLSNVASGVYNLRVKVDYNRGHDFIVRNYQLSVMSDVTARPNEVLMVNAATTSMTLIQGGSATYTFSIANLGTSARTLNFEVTGQEAWATTRIEPMVVTILPDSSREVKVTLNAKSDSDLGSKVFTVKVKEGNTVINELQFNAEIQGKTNNLASLRSGLEIGFIVLLVILVILGIILAVNKLRGPKEEGGESYY